MHLEAHESQARNRLNPSGKYEQIEVRVVE